jgi:hypothetical protein
MMQVLTRARAVCLLIRGESGFIRMKRGVNKTGICGISQQASYPSVAKGSPLPSASVYPHSCLLLLVYCKSSSISPLLANAMAGWLGAVPPKTDPHSRPALPCNCTAACAHTCGAFGMTCCDSSQKYLCRFLLAFLNRKTRWVSTELAIQKRNFALKRFGNDEQAAMASTATAPASRPAQNVGRLRHPPTQRARPAVELARPQANRNASQPKASLGTSALQVRRDLATSTPS